MLLSDRTKRPVESAQAEALQQHEFDEKPTDSKKKRWTNTDWNHRYDSARHQHGFTDCNVDSRWSVQRRLPRSNKHSVVDDDVRRVRFGSFYYADHSRKIRSSPASLFLSFVDHVHRPLLFLGLLRIRKDLCRCLRGSSTSILCGLAHCGEKGSDAYCTHSCQTVACISGEYMGLSNLPESQLRSECSQQVLRRDAVQGHLLDARYSIHAHWTAHMRLPILLRLLPVTEQRENVSPTVDFFRIPQWAIIILRGHCKSRSPKYYNLMLQSIIWALNCFE